MENEIKQHKSSARVWSVCRWVEKEEIKQVAQTLEGLEELKGKREEETDANGQVPVRRKGIFQA